MINLVSLEIELTALLKAVFIILYHLCHMTIWSVEENPRPLAEPNLIIGGEQFLYRYVLLNYISV